MSESTFCPHKPEIQNSETMINLAGTVGWQLCGAPEEWPVNCVPRVHGVLIHCPSDRRQWATPRGELGRSTCEFNKPSMRSTASPGSGGCQRSCFPPFRTWVYFSRLESNKTVHKESRQFHVGGWNELLDVWRPPLFIPVRKVAPGHHTMTASYLKGHVEAIASNSGRSSGNCAGPKINSNSRICYSLQSPGFIHHISHYHDIVDGKLIVVE